MKKTGRVSEYEWQRPFRKPKGLLVYSDVTASGPLPDEHVHVEGRDGGTKKKEVGNRLTETAYTHKKTMKKKRVFNQHGLRVQFINVSLHIFLFMLGL